MYTFLSQLATARKSFVGENWRSWILSDGSWFCCTSTSLLVSPVVVLAGVAAVDPKSAISKICGCVHVCCASGWFAVVELARALVEAGKKFWRVDVEQAGAPQWCVGCSVVELRVLRKARAAVFMFLHPTQRKTIQASLPTPMPGAA